MYFGLVLIFGLIALVISIPTGVLLAGVLSQLFATILNFNVRGFAFNWSIDPDGDLVITFANGDANRYTRFDLEGDVSRAVLVGTLATTESFATRTELIPSDGVTDFSEPNLISTSASEVLKSSGQMVPRRRIRRVG